MSRHCLGFQVGFFGCCDIDLMSQQCHDIYSRSVLVLLFYKCDVATSGQCCDNVGTLGKLWNRCCDIVVNVATLRRIFLLSSRNFLLVFSYFIYSISIHAREYKSINIEKDLNSSMNSNTQIFNSINLAYIHCIA